MITIELIIKEKEKVEFKNKIATAINVDIKEEGIKATKGEKEAKNLLMKKLNIQNELIIDNTKNKEFEEVVNLLKEILK